MKSVAVSATSAMKWQGIDITLLDDKRLYNIVKAIERGTWKISGVRVGIDGDIRQALLEEYGKRTMDEAEIQRQNAKWEAENVLHIIT